MIRGMRVIRLKVVFIKYFFLSCFLLPLCKIVDLFYPDRTIISFPDYLSPLSLSKKNQLENFCLKNSLEGVNCAY